MMPPRQRLGWVVRAILPSERFCHGIELDDQKIVTLSRYLHQHVRPMSEVIQNPGSGFSEREPRMDRTPQVVQTAGQVEVQDKQESGDVEMTVRTVSKINVELSRRCKEAPWGFQPMDSGGDGDCGHRALATAFKLAAGEPPEKAKAHAVKHGASHTLSAAASRKLTIARSNHLTRRHAGAQQETEVCGSTTGSTSLR